MRPILGVGESGPGPATREVVNASVTRDNYERLGGPKRYLELPFGHWSNQPEFWETIVQAADEWFKEHLTRKNECRCSTHLRPNRPSKEP